MKKATLTQIKNSVLAAGGTYKKTSFKVNGNNAYYVNGKIYTKQQLIDAFYAGYL